MCEIVRRGLTTQGALREEGAIDRRSGVTRRPEFMSALRGFSLGADMRSPAPAGTRLRSVVLGKSCQSYGQFALTIFSAVACSTPATSTRVSTRVVASPLWSTVVLALVTPLAEASGARPLRCPWTSTR
jgi:hypothetical protein